MIFNRHVQKQNLRGRQRADIKAIAFGITTAAVIKPAIKSHRSHSFR